MSFKDTDTGKIPSEWDVKMIQEVAEVISGATPKTKFPEYWDGKIAWITPKDLSSHTDRHIFYGERMITDEGLKNSSAKLMPKGSVLFSSRAPIGYTAIAAQELCTNQGFKSMICKPKILDNYFMYYMMNYKKNEIENIASGSTFKEVSGKTIKEFKIPIPPIEEQKAIAKILSDLDEKIETNNKINKKLEEMAQAIFKQWFVDFEFPNENGEPYKSSGGEMVESELGMIPKGWEVTKIGECCKIIRGASPRPIQEFMSDKGIPWLKISDASDSNSKYILNIKEYIKEEGIAKSRKVTRGTLVLSNSATPGIAKIMLTEACVHDGWLIFSEYKNITKEYIYCHLVREREKILSLSNGSVFRNLKTDILKSYPVIIPRNDIIKKATELLISINSNIEKNVKETKKIEEVRDILLPKLMSGEIRVSLEE